MDNNALERTEKSALKAGVMFKKTNLKGVSI